MALEEPSLPVSACVLLVDDDAMIRETVGVILEDMGYTVLLAEGGREGLAVYQERAEEISLVLLDMTMPDMDGAQCLQALREINPKVNIVVSSGYQESYVVKDLGDCVADGFVQKPYTPECLDEVLRKVLQSS